MSSEFLIRLPLERVAVLIGPKGSTKKKIENLTDCKLLIDSQSGDVILVAEEELEDPISLWKARDMIKAIGRGFSPPKAYQINNPGWGFANTKDVFAFDSKSERNDFVADRDGWDFSCKSITRREAEGYKEELIGDPCKKGVYIYDGDLNLDYVLMWESAYSM